MQLRQTAYKLWISDLINGNYVRQEGEWDPNYVEVHNKQVSRINLIGTVVNKFNNEDGSYAALTIDDSTSTIRVKAFREDTSLFNNIQTGQIVMVIGKVREYNAELFIVPEIIKPLSNPNWELVRKLELLKTYGKPNYYTQEIKIKEEPKKQIALIEPNYNEEVVVENVATEESPKQKIHSIIANSINMISIKELTEKSNLSDEEVEQIINELLEDGEIYEPKAGYLKSI